MILPFITFAEKFITIYHCNFFEIFPDLCGWLSGRSKSYLLSWISKELLQYSNLNHSCPYEDNVYIDADNLSIKQFLHFSIFLPSGKFRVNVDITEGRSKAAFFSAQALASISDK